MLQVFHSRYTDEETSNTTHLKLLVGKSDRIFVVAEKSTKEGKKIAAGKMVSFPGFVGNTADLLKAFEDGGYQRGTVYTHHKFVDPLPLGLAAISVALQEGVFSVQPLLHMEGAGLESFHDFRHVITPKKLWEFCNKIIDYFS